MAVQAAILPSYYQDSVMLMRVASEVRGHPGVREAAAFMGTPANHEILERAGLATAETRRAHPDDLILTVEADSDTIAAAALAAARALLLARRQAVEAGGVVRPRTLDAALRLLPNANLAAISVPGPYASFEARRALRRGLHVFLFSDNVPLAEEIQLKQEAARRGLLCMGPDCGTAYVNGSGLGFANRVPRGRIGCVAASGTGLQAVACRVAAQGEGISQGIGVGGRDLSAEVGGLMTIAALDALARDPTTEAIVLISKPPDADVARRLRGALGKIDKPLVVCWLGTSPLSDSQAVWTETLDEAADAVVARLRHQPWHSRPFREPALVTERLKAARSRGPLGAPGVRGLYTGGTLAHEAHLVLQKLLGDTRPHRVMDLGDDAYTVGRPHPMIDPERRSASVIEAGGSSEVGVVLMDLVLGSAGHPDPAEPLVQAVRTARVRAAAEGRCPAFVASVVGTSLDPQGLDRQVARLREADIEVLPTNAEAARFAALLVNPELESRLLGSV